MLTKTKKIVNRQEMEDVCILKKSDAIKKEQVCSMNQGAIWITKRMSDFFLCKIEEMGVMTGQRRKLTSSFHQDNFKP